ncbi:MAG: NAD(P)H-dependent glycerol-3-phosphate dehydrogenase [Gammaproteobacteria bacterium]|nr:MAG: NAD(P)H-dependent glycerol-3-phosphate dehydrogenase [Gammaproteobacteria bacterium]
MSAAAKAGSIVVLGSGSWGTALAVQLARANGTTALWGRDRALLHEMSATRMNQQYLPAVPFPDNLRIEADIARAVAAHRDLLICVPSRAFRETIAAIGGLLRPESRVAWATKGFEQHSGKLPHEIAGELLGERVALAVLSGPTFAGEVAAGLPAAMTVAANNAAFAADLAARISSHSFRAYTSLDMVGVEVGGAVKNVLAIATGIADGLKFGANARIALINRGLAEMTRLGVSLGARAETFMGLSGMGDLVLTCTDNQSRNRRAGLLIAAGRTREEAAREIGFVCEGIYGARAVWQVAQRRGVDMPICQQVYRILYEELSPQEAVMALMSRALKPEA